MGVPIAKFNGVLMQVWKGYFVVLADDAPFEQTPESLDGIRVDLPIGVADLMVNDRVGHECLDRDIPAIFIRDEHGVAHINIAAHELGKALRVQLVLANRASNYPSAAFQHADEWNLIRAASTLVGRPAMWAIAFARFASNVALVHLDNAVHKLRLLEHGVANPHPHVPCGVLVDSDIASELAR